MPQRSSAPSEAAVHAGQTTTDIGGTLGTVAVGDAIAAGVARSH